MKRIGQLFLSLLVVAIGSYSSAQVEKPVKTEIAVDKVLGTSVAYVQQTLLPLAMAMPEDKYGFAPTNGEFKGVRTFAQQLKHVGATNFIYASSILGEKPPADVGDEEDGPASLMTKGGILEYVSGSFAYVCQAVAPVEQGE